MAWRRGRHYSSDLRSRVLAAVDGGLAVRKAAVLFQVSISYIYKAQIRRRKTGSAEASPVRGHCPRKLTPAQEMALDQHIRAHGDITLAALKRRLEIEHGVRISEGALWSAIDRLGLTLKKKPCAPASKSDRTWPPGVGSGRRPSPSSILSAWSSSTRPA